MRAFRTPRVARRRCSLNVDYTGTYYQCNPDGSCPPATSARTWCACRPIRRRPRARRTSRRAAVTRARCATTAACGAGAATTTVSSATAPRIDSDVPVQRRGPRRTRRRSARAICSRARSTRRARSTAGATTTAVSSATARRAIAARPCRSRHHRRDAARVGLDHACALRADGRSRAGATTTTASSATARRPSRGTPATASRGPDRREDRSRAATRRAPCSRTAPRSAGARTTTASSASAT